MHFYLALKIHRYVCSMFTTFFYRIARTTANSWTEIRQNRITWSGMDCIQKRLEVIRWPDWGILRLSNRDAERGVIQCVIHQLNWTFFFLRSVEKLYIFIIISLVFSYIRSVAPCTKWITVTWKVDMHIFDFLLL